MDNSKNYIGNTSLISNDEEAMAAMLRRKNLEHANQIHKKVSPRVSAYTKYGKRGLDILLSLAACGILAPVNLVFAICTYFDVGRPILFKQSRCGKDGKEFLLVKFRNMNNKTDENGKLLPAAQRVTKFGRIMRKYSFDELLNFWSVLKGDMSIIGPRPLPMFFRDRMSERHRMREAVRPGLECPRVISLKEEEVGYYQLQFENDIWYVENVSFATDIKMLFNLFQMVFESTERGKHADVGTYFVGYNEEGIALSLRLAKEQYPNILEIENDLT